MAGSLIIRADASIDIGTGHVMRCLALAHAWRKAGGHVCFAATAIPDMLEDRLASEGFPLLRLDVDRGSTRDAQQTIEQAQRQRAGWVVADGYAFDAAYQRTIKEAGLKLLVLDDYGHAEHYYADLILNQNISARESLYTRRETYTRLLLGTDYVLLRPDFLQWRDWKREIPEIASHVLVTLGGSDLENHTAKVLDGLNAIPVASLQVIAVIGSSNPHAEALRRQVTSLNKELDLHENVSDMAALMAWADVAVAAGGSTNWELAFMGLPAIIGILADNQEEIAHQLGTAGIVTNIGRYQGLSAATLQKAMRELIHDPVQRTAMAQKGRRLIDGQGAKHVLQFMQTGIRLRPAQEEDVRIVWEWANDPVIRMASFTSDAIPWEDHVKWYKNKMVDRNSLIYLGLDMQNRPFGQIRFEKATDDEAIVSVSLAEWARGKGYGTALIKIGSQQVLRELSIRRIHAYIKSDNLASIRAFRKAGYWQIADTKIKGYPAIDMVFERGGR